MKGCIYSLSYLTPSSPIYIQDLPTILKCPLSPFFIYSPSTLLHIRSITGSPIFHSDTASAVLWDVSVKFPPILWINSMFYCPLLFKSVSHHARICSFRFSLTNIWIGTFQAVSRFSPNTLLWLSTSDSLNHTYEWPFNSIFQASTPPKLTFHSSLLLPFP